MRYFGSKRELYRSVLNSRYADLSQLETIRDICPDTALEEMLRCILHDLFSFNASHPEFSRLLSWENLQGATHLDPDAARSARLPGWKRLMTILASAQDAGKMRRDVDLNWMVYVLQALTIVYFSNRHTMEILTGIPFGTPEDIDRSVELYADLLARGLTSPDRKEPDGD